VAIHPHPVPTISGNDSTCLGLPNLYFTESGNSLYQWNISPGNTIVAGGTVTDTSIIVTWNNLGNQWINVNFTDTNNCEALLPTQLDVWVEAGDTVEVSIISTDATVCAGIPVTFTATSINTGTNPLFQWFINGVDTNFSDSVFTYTPTQTDTVYSVVTSYEPCRSNNPDTSNLLVIHVLPNLPVSVAVTLSENPVCDGESVTLTATPINGGISPVYQWDVNGSPTGTNDYIYTFIPSSGDQVWCQLTSSEQCTTNNPATSDTIIIQVDPLLPVGIFISASENPVCGGIPVTFTATPINGGSLPGYQWHVNGAYVGGDSSNYTYLPVDVDLVSCILTSNEDCITGNPAISNSITMSVGQQPDVSFSVCFDSITTLNAEPFKLKGGIPLGGTYSGPGVDQITGYFNPAMAGLGSKAIIYTYTNWYSCSDNEVRRITVINPAPFTCGNDLLDIRDSMIYPTVQIGPQCWMAANLSYGSHIPHTTPQRDNCLPEKYTNPVSGVGYPSSFYQWDELMRYEDTEQIQGLCPPGWHVPAEVDWNQLFAYFQGSAFAGSPLIYSGYSGFNALLSGAAFFNKSWDFDGFATLFWSSTSHGQWKAWAHGMNDYNYSVSYYPSYRANAISARCIED